MPRKIELVSLNGKHSTLTSNLICPNVSTCAADNEFVSIYFPARALFKVVKTIALRCPFHSSENLEKVIRHVVFLIERERNAKNAFDARGDRFDSCN